MIKVDLTEKEAEELQSAVDEHMMLCYQAMDYDGEELPDYLNQYSLYCGCHICETREYLMATFNWLRSKNIVDIAVV